jgi:hypothetical protein
MRMAASTVFPHIKHLSEVKLGYEMYLVACWASPYMYATEIHAIP